MTPTKAPPPCPSCQIAKDYQAYRWFNLECIHCGARLIQNLGKHPISASQCKARRQAVLADWVEYGHCEKTIRALVAGPPCTGPEKHAASEPPTSEKTRSATRK